MIEGYKRNNFWKRFRLKIKASKKIYGKKDRRLNRNAQTKE